MLGIPLLLLVVGGGALTQAITHVSEGEYFNGVAFGGTFVLAASAGRCDSREIPRRLSFNPADARRGRA